MSTERHERVPPSGTMARPEISLVVVAWQDQAMLDRCLAAAAVALGATASETIVVDNGSQPPLARAVSATRWIRNARNAGFARAANAGAGRALGRHLLFLNSDAELDADAIGPLLAALAGDSRFAAVAPLARGAAGETRFPGLRFLDPFNQTAELLLGRLAGRFGRTIGPDYSAATLVEVDWLRASVLLVRASCFRAVCGFDEGYFFYEEDEDLCWRLRRRGYRLAVDMRATVTDPGGVSTARAGRWPRIELFRGQRRFVRKRFGGLGESVYRWSASVAFVGKLARRSLRRRNDLQYDADADALRGLWTRSSRPVRMTAE